MKFGIPFALAVGIFVSQILLAETIPAFFQANCIECHNAKKKKGGINLTEPVEFTLETAVLWQDILDNVQRGDMPPEEADQPTDADRREFLSTVRAKLDRMYEDAGIRDFRFTRLTNRQIACSWMDLLQIDRDFSGDLIEDPVGKHGESLQSKLDMSAGHMELYLAALERAVFLAVPDLANPPTPYRLHGNDWEQQHYLNRNDLAHGSRRKHKRYRGPQWLGDDFEVPIPPNPFFRIYIDDNRHEGQFRVKVHVRNEPPQQGGDLQKHELSLFFDKGFKSPQHTIDSFTVAAKPGSQVFEVFGNVFDFPGVDPAPIADEKDPYGVMAHFKYRFLTVQNSSPLRSPADTPMKNHDWVTFGDAHFIRADDRWIEAWGEEFAKKNWLKPSHAGSDHRTRGKPSVYKEVMKDTGYAVIERIEFDLPWQWPPAGVQPFLKEGKLDDGLIAEGLKDFARRAWRRELFPGEVKELDGLIADKLANSTTKADALRDLLMAVLADTRFLFYTDVEKDTENQDFELVSRLAGFLWRGIPDEPLLELAARPGAITKEQLSTEVTRMIADPRSSRFTTDFATSWMAFHKLDQIAVNPNYFGDWNPKFKEYMKQQSVAFFDHLLHGDASCLDILSADYVVANDIMAKYYGVPKPESGHQFSPVQLADHRGGVVSQAAFLLAHGDGEDAHAVNRGVWLRARLLGDPPREPPAEVPALAELEEKAPESVALSTKDKLALHRKGICLDCHRDIDPWGVAMESLGATGLPREKILRLIPGKKVSRKYHPVTDEAEIRGDSVHGMEALKKLLREKHAGDFARGFSGSIFSFALGRPLGYREDAAIDQLAKEFKESDYRLTALIQSIVLRPEFRHPNGAKL